MALLIVDVQGIYEDNYGSGLVKRISDEASKHDKVEMFFVGGHFSPETEDSVRKYWSDNGASQNFLAKVRLHEKEYGYLGGWEHLSDRLIVDALKYMHRHDIWSSRHIPKEDLMALIRQYAFAGWMYPIPEEPIFLPDFNYTAFQGNTWMTCGGSIHQCLPEIETILEGVGVQTLRNDDLSW